MWCGRIGSGTAHVIPRGRKRTRYVMENGWYSCIPCHRKFDDDPCFRKKVISTLVGISVYKDLKEVADGKKTFVECGFTEID